LIENSLRTENNTFYFILHLQKRSNFGTQKTKR